MKKLVVLLVSLVLISCASDSDMRAKFGNGDAYEFIEIATGDIYMVRHTFGDHYSLNKLNDK